MQNACHNWLLNFETILFFPTVWTLWYEKFIFFKNNLSKEQLESVKIHRVLLLYILMCVCVCRVSLLLIGWTNTWRIKNNCTYYWLYNKRGSAPVWFCFFFRKKNCSFFLFGNYMFCFVFVFVLNRYCCIVTVSIV